MSDKKKYYITTPIYYSSGDLHLGHCYTTVICDALARFKKMMGYDVFYLTGTDEHGQKVEEAAKAKGVTPKEYVDALFEKIVKLWAKLNINFSKIIRTTDDYHEKTVQKIYEKLLESGDIYKSEYEGWYCTPCESFWTESQLVNGKCPDCGREVHLEKEESYFFRLSNYADRLLKLYEDNPDFIAPKSRMNEMINNFIKPGLKDLCVSRTSFSWGIPVTFDPKHVIYVWIDALSNYITFLGYDVNGNSSAEFNKYWPADLHLIGKDILRFHTIYWPIMLHALGLELPKKIFGHPWLLFASDKMSKSKGNITYADDLVQKYGVDAVRYYLLHEMPFASDGNFTVELLEKSINSDLANNYGNLVNRTIAMINKYFAGIIPKPSNLDTIDNDLIKSFNELPRLVDDKMNNYRISDAINHILDVLSKCNKYIDDTTPWVLAKDDSQKDRLATVLYNLLEGIRICTILLSCFIPTTSKKVFNELKTKKVHYEDLEYGNLEVGNKLENPEVLFARIQ